MSSANLTERQRREQQYYDQFAEKFPVEHVDFAPVLGQERRPWNSYWYAFQLAVDARKPGPQRALDFGCGRGEHSVLLAHLGYEVSGFDISEANIAAARRLVEGYSLPINPVFSIETAERLTYSDSHFDLVFGVDILHHVEIDRAIVECLRVLKPGGRAVFREPLESPLFDPIRNSCLVKRFFPNTASFERHVTEDEKKVTWNDVDQIRRLSPACDLKYFRVLSRASSLVKRFSSSAPEILLEKVDHWITAHLKWFGRAGAGAVVIELEKKEG